MKKAFNRIIVGLIFIVFDINIGINLLPDFIGYVLIYDGCRLLSEKEENFKKAILPSKILAITSFLQIIGKYLKNNNVIYWNFPMISELLGIIIAIVWLYIVYHICKGIYNLAEERTLVYITSRTKIIWNIYFYLMVVTTGIKPLVLTLSYNLRTAIIILAIAGTLINIILILLINEARKRILE